MIDLHCHVLPGIDDGAVSLEDSLHMVRVAIANGIETMVATPHVDISHAVEAETIAAGVADLRMALDEDALPMTLLSGAEVSLSRLPTLEEHELRALALNQSSYILVESPYVTAGSLIEESIFALQVRGFHPLLAHPERCPEFQRDLPRLERLVESGVACSITAGSVGGQFGETVRRFACRLLDAGLVHNLATDAHDPVKRPPSFQPAFRASRFPMRDRALQAWLTTAVPAAIIEDAPLPERPLGSRPSRWRRLVSGR